MRSGGPRIIENIDLSSQQVHEQIAANDLWVDGVGLPKTIDRGVEGWDVLRAAESKSRDHETVWPSKKTTS